MDQWHLYHQMLRSRRFEAAVMKLWDAGHISGEMHMGLGEEAIAAGTVCQLEEGDALALDHRGTPPLVIRGVALVSLLREMLGCEDGLCGGRGGHMHLFSPEHLAVSSGIVGASAPAAVGLALSAQHLRPGKIAVAYFGEGAMNQGMVMEAFNLAVVWNLPVLFVCKDNDWSITTHSADVTGGSLMARARSFGMDAVEIDGSDVTAVWNAAASAIAQARNGGGSTFLLAHCTHLEGHFLGDPLLRITRQPVKGFAPYAIPLTQAATGSEGGAIWQRAESLMNITKLLGSMANDHRLHKADPVARLRRKLLSEKDRLDQIEQAVSDEIESVVATALADLPQAGKD
jgi:acetoin:2,6-dichlorophenolindophenol oxidoreductase subunit alpha